MKSEVGRVGQEKLQRAVLGNPGRALFRNKKTWSKNEKKTTASKLVTFYFLSLLLGVWLNEPVLNFRDLLLTDKSPKSLLWKGFP